VASRAGLRTILRGRDFRRLFATRLLSQFSDGVFQVGLTGYLLFSPERQTSPAQAALAAAVLLLPYSIVGPFAGVLIDRWQRRQILVYAPLVRAGTVGVTGSLLLAGDDGALFYAAALIALGINRFFLSSLSAALPHVVTPRELVLANAVSVTSGSLLTFAGAGCGFLLGRLSGTGQWGAAVMLFCSGAMYVLASLTATTLGRTLLGPLRPAARLSARQAVRQVTGDLVAGTRHVWRRPPAAAGLGAIALHRFLFGILTIMTVLLFGNYFPPGDDAGLSGFALSLTVSGIGFFAGAAVTPAMSRRIGKNLWIATLLAFGAVAEAVFAAPFAETPYMVGAFALGLVSQGVKISVDTILQESVADAFRGRVFALHDLLFNAMFVAGFGVAALMLPPDGRSYAVLGVIAGGYALGAVAFRLATRRYGGVDAPRTRDAPDVSGTPDPPDGRTTPDPPDTPITATSRP
jgi:MFS family permease